MREEAPIACSLGARALRERLDAIGAVGSGLVGRSREGEAHVLRFRGGGAMRRRLEEIVAAEAECCPFLQLSLREGDGEVVLMIAAPEEGRATADALAEAF